MVRGRLRLSFSVSALVTLIVGVLVTAAGFAAVRRLEYSRENIEFEQFANLRLFAISEGLRDALGGLRSINQLFAVIGTVEREQFSAFARPLVERYPYIQAITFNRAVSAAERPAYEAAMRRAYPGFFVSEVASEKRTEAKPRPMYFVIDYIQPPKGNERAIGLDAALFGASTTDPQRQIGDVRISRVNRLLRIIEGKDSQGGFMLRMPVFLPVAQFKDFESGRRAVLGETTLIFKAGNLAEEILTAKGFEKMPGMEFILDVGERSGEPNPWATQASGASTDWLSYGSVRRIAKTLDLGGKPIHLAIIYRVPATRAHDSLYLLFAGLLFSVIAAAYVHGRLSRAARIDELIGKRTSALAFANLRLSEDLEVLSRTEKAMKLQGRVIEMSSNAIIIAGTESSDYLIQYVNPAFERTTGYAAADVIGQSLRVLKGESQDSESTKELLTALREKREAHVTFRCFRKDGSPYWIDISVAPVQDDAGEVSHFVVALYDISAAKRYAAELQFQANHDKLTGMANRNLLSDRLSHALAFAERYQQPLWVVCIDLDRFKYVNDTLGHEAADNFLKAVALRIQTAARDIDTLARVGSDEFVLVMTQREIGELHVGVIERIMAVVAQPIQVNDHEFHLTCSVGAAVYPTDGDSAETLLKHAHIAASRAKERGRNMYQFYAPAMNERVLERMRLETDLRNAVERDEFVLHYQPQVNLSTGRVVGVEALIRWNHPVHGMMLPGRFIGLAEETGMIVSMGAWALRTACAQTKTWQDAGFDRLRVAVNVSARQFADPDFTETITNVLAETGLAPQCLELELTETLVMTDVEQAIGIMADLKALDVKLAIDDFGTGYSGLAYLKRFPIDVLKIDQSFVRDITEDPDDAAIVVSIISLARSLRLEVIAEGVETHAQLAHLQRYGCHEMQGYLFSRPVPAEALTELLREGSCLTAVA
jgi:diguanylate cyclase (GGDEF)-like protein/PAS domain S-box-containing protein